MKYPILHTFRDGYDTFHEGEVREMSEEKARKYAACGWVYIDGVTPNIPSIPAGVESSLDIDNARLGMVTKGI